jgi:phospholipid transport system substrate-binding protein
MQAMIRRELLVLVTILPMWCMCTPLRADESPKAFVDRLVEAGNGILSAGSNEDARLKCLRLLAWAFDVPSMAQYALGDAWPDASPSQRNAFRKAFEDHIVASYLREAGARRGKSILFVGIRQEREGQWLAATQLNDQDRPGKTWTWRLRRFGSDWRVVDVMANGTSMLYSERQEYARVFESSHHNVDAVIEFVARR